MQLFQICASIDGTGVIGEYIRDGLEYDKWLEYYKLGMTYEKHPGQMRLDFTLTLPGLYEVKNMFDLSKELDTPLLAKVTFAFTPDIIMSPMSLPRGILNSFIDELLKYCQPYTWKQKPNLSLPEGLTDKQIEHWKFYFDIARTEIVLKYYDLNVPKYPEIKSRIDDEEYTW